MNQKKILSFLVIVFLISSILSVISLFYAVDKTTISGHASNEGSISITVIQVCGNNICAVNEDCSADASYCTDSKCYEPTCTNGCGETTVANGGTDEACSGSTGCTGGNCQCDGSGNCISSGATPAPQPSQGGASQGGKAEKKEKEEDLQFSEYKIKIITKVNKITTKEFKVINPSKNTKEIKIDIEKLQDKVTLSENTFVIQPGQAKTITLTIFSDTVGVETGRMILATPTKTYAIPVILETESENVLFDVSLEVKPKTVLPGDEISAQTVIYNINEIGQVDIDVVYSIKDFYNNLILEEKEKITIETQATTSRKFRIPVDAREGEYVIIAQVSYQGVVGTASESFFIGKIEEPSIINVYYIIILIILILLFIILIIYKKRKLVKKVESKMQEKEATEQKIKSLITRYLDRGFTKEEITQELRGKGWPEEIIEKLLR